MSLFTKSVYEGGMSSVSRRQRRGDAWTTTRATTQTIETALWILSAILFLLILLFCPDQSFGQASNAVAVSFGPVISPYTTISANAPYRVCLASALGVPCSTAGVTIYSDINLTHVQSNPTFANSQGIVNFFTTSGFYQIQLTPVPGQTYTYYAFPSGGGSGGGLTIQTNSVNNFSQSLLNFVNGTGILPTNPSGGIEQINCNTTAAAGSIGCSFIPLFGSGSPTATCSASNVSQEYYDLTPANANPQIWICKQTTGSPAYAWQQLPNFTFPYPGTGVPLSSGSAWLTSYQVQGTDSNLLSSGTISSSLGSLLCTDANNGATTSGCAIPPSVTFQHNGSATGINQMIWNANDTFPAPPAGNVNVTWQHDLATGSWSGYVPSGGGGTGCTITGIGDTDVLSVHPSGTCYGSSNFTWDDASGKENLVIGNTTSTANAVQSYLIGNHDSVAINPIVGTPDHDFYFMGTYNVVSDTTGASQAAKWINLIGDTNEIDVSGTATAADMGMFGAGNTATFTTNRDTAMYIMGVDNSVEDTENKIDDVEIVGNSNDVNGAPSTVQIFGHLNQARDVSYDNPLDVDQVIVGAQNYVHHTGSGSYSDYFEVFGHENYEHDCWDCIAIGSGVEEATNHEMGVGMSRVPELRLSPSNIQRTPLTMSLPAPINTAQGLTELFITTPQTCNVAFTGGTGSGGAGQVYISGWIGMIQHYSIQITNGGSYSVPPTGATLSGGPDCAGAGPISVQANLLSVQACSAGLEGSFASITDSSTNSLGATITGGGTNHVFGYCDGTHWIVAAAAGSGGGGGGVGGSGTTGYLPAWTAGTTLGNSHIDDGVTTASTLTAHESLAVNPGSGNAGAVSLTQGTAVSNETTAVTLTVPSSVTSYRVQLPGVQPSGSNTYLSCTAADPAVCSWAAGGGGGGSIPVTNKLLAGDNAGGAVATHIDDGQTTAGKVTSTEPFVVDDGSGNGGVYQASAGTDPGGVAGTATFGADATGKPIIHDGTGAAGHPCTDIAPCTGNSGVPNSIPNLMFWFSADRLNQANGTNVPRWFDPTTAMSAPALNHFGATLNTSVINGQPAVNFNNNTNNRYLINNAPILQNSTVFVVFSPNAVSANQIIVAGGNNSYAVFVGPTGHFSTAVASVTNVCVGTATVTAGTWYQANCTWSYGGAWAARLNEASDGSGTASGTVTQISDGLGYASGGTPSDANSMIAEIIIYNRVLTGPEITTIETYLHGKYGI